MRIFGLRLAEDSVWISDRWQSDPGLPPAQRCAKRISQFNGLRLEEADFLHGDTRVLLLSASLVRHLGDLLCRDGELIPYEVDGLDLYQFRPFGGEDAIDLRRTKAELYGTQIVRLADISPDLHDKVRALEVHFLPDRLDGRAVVAPVGCAPWACFVTEPLADAMRGLGLRGAMLEPVWQDDTEVTPIGPPRAPVPAPPEPAPYEQHGAVYAVLVEGRSILGPSVTWPLPSPDGQPGAWVERPEPLEVTRSGLHLLERDPYLAWPAWGMRVFEAEVGANAICRNGVVVASRARLLREAPAPAWWTEGVRFITQEIPRVRWFDPSEPPDPAWRMFVETAPKWRHESLAWHAADAVPQTLPDPPTNDWQLQDLAEAAGRREAAEIHWGVAFRIAHDAMGEPFLHAPNGDLVANTDTPSDTAAGTCLLRGVLSDLEVAPDAAALLEAEWDALRRGYVPVSSVNGELFVSTRTFPPGVVND